MFFSAVTLVVTIQMQSIVSSREFGPGTSACHGALSGLRTLSPLRSHPVCRNTDRPTDPQTDSIYRGQPSPPPRSSLIPVSGTHRDQDPLLRSAAFTSRGKSEHSTPSHTDPEQPGPKQVRVHLSGFTVGTETCDVFCCNTTTHPPTPKTRASIYTCIYSNSK